jgi:hypothetical protein
MRPKLVAKLVVSKPKLIKSSLERQILQGAVFKRSLSGFIVGD